LCAGPQTLAGDEDEIAGGFARFKGSAEEEEVDRLET